MPDSTNRYKTWPVEEIIRDHASRVIPGASGLMTGDRDALLFSVAISLKRIADNLEVLVTAVRDRIAACPSLAVDLSTTGCQDYRVP
jgi:hypothetical protein